MYVIDGYNLLHALARHKGTLPAEADRARSRMLELLSAMARSESTQARVFFDGTPPSIAPGELSQPGLRVHFCGPERESADHAIKEFVANAANARKLHVVSADREVVNACRLAGARVIDSRGMAERLARIAPSNNPRQRPEKPTRGTIGKLEREMLDEIGDWKGFLRDVEDDLR